MPTCRGRASAVLAINRLCAPGSELAIEQRWYPSTALDDLLGIEDGKINDTRLYRCLDRILPHKTKLERHLQAALWRTVWDRVRCVAVRFDEHVCGRRGGKESDDAARLLARSPSRLRADGDRTDRQQRRLSVQLRDLQWKPSRCFHDGKRYCAWWSASMAKRGESGCLIVALSARKILWRFANVE